MEEWTDELHFPNTEARHIFGQKNIIRHILLIWRCQNKTV